MTDSLRREMPRMLRDHVAIRAATQRLATVAQEEGQPMVVRFVDKLTVHARTEEEILYPAAIVVGDLMRARGARP
jgi:hemerythrin superfamily protein